MKVVVVLAVCLLQNGGVFGANPNYSYHVKIDDPAHVNFQEKAESRKGEFARGYYSVLEPNGALRTVSYTADDSGFNPIVSYSYGHPQSSVTVTSATGAASILKQPGVYAPAYVADNRVQIVDKSNIYAAPPPAINFEAFTLPGPSAPVVVPAPLRQAAPVKLASAAIATNYAPAYVPPPRAYLPPPPQVLAVEQPQVVVQQPQVVVQQQPQVLAIPQRQVVVQQPQVVVQHQPQVFAVPQQQVVAVAPQPQVVAVKRIRPAKFLTVPAPQPVKVIETPPAIAVVKDSYAEPPRDTFRDPGAATYADSVKISEPTAEYGPPNYVPPPLITEEPVKVKVVEQPPVKVVQTTKVVQPVIQEEIAYAPPPPPVFAVQKVAVAAPPPAIVQTVQPAAPIVSGLYAGAVGFHTHTVNPDSYVHNYGTQGFQVTSSRKFNKAVLAVPAVQKQLIRAPTPVYGPPAVAVQTAVQQPVPVYGPPPVKVYEQPRPVYGPPPVKVVQQQVAIAQPVAVQTVAPAAPLYAAPAQPLYTSPPAQVAISAPAVYTHQAQVALPAPVLTHHQAPVSAPVLAASPAVAVSGKKQNPLTFAYSYDQGGAKVTHSYSGSGW